MSSRRLNHEGTISRTASGKWRAAIEINGKRLYGPSVERKADAIPALRQKLGQASLHSGSQEMVQSFLLRTVNQQLQEGAIRDTTAQLKRLLIGKHIEGTSFGRLPVSAVTQDVFRSFLGSLDLGPHSTRNVAGVISTAFRSTGLTLQHKSKKPASKKARVLTPSERDKIMRAAKGEEKWLIGFLMQLGLRRGEALGVMHEDRDADGVNLQRQVVRVKGALLITPLKNAQSEAWVPLPRWMQRYLGKGQGFVFQQGGRPRSPGWVNTTVRRVAERAGIGVVTPHDLRHTAAMGLLESGVDAKTAAEILRHDPVMLLTIYAKSRRDLKRAAMGAWLK